MPHPLRVPRINNNDDQVRILRLAVAEGQFVRRGETVAEIETDKAVAEVPAERDGFVLKILGGVDETAAVGEVLAWFGETADEPIPDQEAGREPIRPAPAAEPTAKARALLVKYGLTADQVPASGERLSAADVEAHAARGAEVAKPPPPARAAGLRPVAAGVSRPMSVEERGMLHTVSWHRDEAVATYLEIEYDPKPWEDHAAAVAAERGLMMSPLLPFLAHRLATLAAESPKLNSTLLDGQVLQYERVNLGYTAQVGETLYLIVVQDAGAMDATRFVDALGLLQRRAFGKKLRPEETQGATVSFTSMARWNVSRHLPILPPFTSLMVAHAAPRHNQSAVLGATYDHRVLSGFDVVRLLQKMARP